MDVNVDQLQREMKDLVKKYGSMQSLKAEIAVLETKKRSALNDIASSSIDSTTGLTSNSSSNGKPWHDNTHFASLVGYAVLLLVHIHGIRLCHFILCVSNRIECRCYSGQ